MTTERAIRGGQQMKFKLTKLPTGYAHISDCGNYKAVKYGGSWFAFHKPQDWPNFGNSCFHKNSESERYPTRGLAQAACRKHSRR